MMRYIGAADHQLLKYAITHGQGSENFLARVQTTLRGRCNTFAKTHGRGVRWFTIARERHQYNLLFHALPVVPEGRYQVHASMHYNYERPLEPCRPGSIKSRASHRQVIPYELCTERATSARWKKRFAEAQTSGFETKHGAVRSRQSATAHSSKRTRRKVLHFPAHILRPFQVAAFKRCGLRYRMGQVIAVTTRDQIVVTVAWTAEYWYQLVAAGRTLLSCSEII